ncbi:SUMF1/EgtB/PvdO family nonheme iron enzyme [Rhizobium sp. WSM1325]|uniref:SUMF1/EgtB/PvdO family nonheme iron enzyme n=1 Tax=Rhizobium sp. WSM1325 TaxID=3444086 RepID=UPI000FF43601|nr:SUMF1/EgtB/PvdO family nonheme iron enzyme [Rhizobium leguminosarum]RWY75272.1 hypothetical protein EHI48_19010 [Rhizobium leguminosarum]
MRRSIVIGSNGPEGRHQLQFAEHDAQKVRDALRSMYCGFETEDGIGITSQVALRRFFRSAESCREEDTFVAYFAGHGLLDRGDLFLLFQNTDKARLMETGLRADDIMKAMNRCRARNRVLILDCCNAGQVAAKSGLRHEEPKAVMKDLGFTSESFEILLASDVLESAREFEALKAGFFSATLCQGLTDLWRRADRDKDGSVSVTDMGDWLAEQAAQHNAKAERDDVVPIPIVAAFGRGKTYLTRPPGSFPYHEIDMADGVPGVVLPLAPFEDAFAYVIGKTPVTNAAMKKSLGRRPGPQARRHDGKRWETQTFDVFSDPDFGGDNQPTVGITIANARQHCQWLREQMSLPLVSPPTPQLWDFALMGGDKYQDERPSAHQLVVHGMAQKTAASVNAVDRSNALGIIDLVGNVWEWCVDEYQWRWFCYGHSGRAKESGYMYIFERAAPSIVGGTRDFKKSYLKGSGFYDAVDEIDITVEGDDIAGGPASKHADVGFRISALIPLTLLPKEMREILEISHPLQYKSARRLPVTA